MCCKMISKIIGLYTLDTRNIPTLFVTAKISPDVAKCPLGCENHPSSLLRPTALEVSSLGHCNLCLWSPITPSWIEKLDLGALFFTMCFRTWVITTIFRLPTMCWAKTRLFGYLNSLNPDPGSVVYKEGLVSGYLHHLSTTPWLAACSPG